MEESSRLFGSCATNFILGAFPTDNSRYVPDKQSVTKTRTVARIGRTSVPIISTKNVENPTFFYGGFI
jgi:hypothetical protein